MRASFNASVLALLLFSTTGTVLTSPISEEQGKSFSFPALYQKDAIKRRRAIARRDTRGVISGSVVATGLPSDGSDDYTYLCPVTIGGQVLNLDLDTGSATFWVFSTLIGTKDPDHTYYNPNKSKTYEAQDGTFTVSYYDGSTATGDIGTETINIVGAKVTGQYFGLASSTAGEFLGDGVVGMGFASLNAISNKPTLFDNLKGLLTAPLWAAYIPWRLNGVYDFGKIVSSRYQPPIAYATVDSSAGLWEFSSPSYKVGQTVYPAANQTGYADTGTSFIYMQEAQVQTYYNAVPSAHEINGTGWAFACNATLPDLSFAVGSNNVYATIKGGRDGGRLNMADLYNDNDECLGALQEADGGKNTYGLTFFAEYYIIFDTTNPQKPQLGFANLQPNSLD